MRVRILENPPRHHHNVAAKPGDVVDLHESIATDLERHGYAEFLDEPVKAEELTTQEHPRRAEAIEFIMKRGYSQEAAEQIFADRGDQVLADIDHPDAEKEGSED